MEGFSRYSARWYMVNVAVVSAVAVGIFIFAVFLQYVPMSHLASHPAVYPSPSLFTEFEDLRNLYCLGLPVEAAQTWEKCERHLRRPYNPLNLPTEARSWAPAPFKRVIALVLDAWRFDWSFYHPEWAEWASFDERSAPFHVKKIVKGPSSKPLHHAYNNYPLLHNSLISPKSHAYNRLFRVLADAPTMTTQRLRGMMCGDVPPFFDLSRSLAGAVDLQDSLLQQLHQSGRRIAVLGDDTWDRLFGEYIATILIDEGFDIQDIETVDNGIHMRLWNILETVFDREIGLSTGNKSFDDINEGRSGVNIGKRRIYDDYDMIIAHFLGLDHLGHSSLYDTIAMHERQDIYDKIIANVRHYLSSGSHGYPYYSAKKNLPLWEIHKTLPRIDFDSHFKVTPTPTASWNDDSFMIAMGDHGMTQSGNHGGSTKEEVEAAFFFSSSRALIAEALFYGHEKLRDTLPSTTTRKLWDPRDPILDSVPYHETDFIQSHNYTFRSFDQVDIASTLSFLMGVPLPWDSLGGIVIEMIPLYDPSTFYRSERVGGSRIGGTAILRDAEGSELVTCIQCQELKHVTHPLLPTDSSWDWLECALAYDEISWNESHRETISRVRIKHDHIHYPGDWRNNNDSFHSFKISQLSWLRHLRYLAHLQHLNVWQLRRRQLEVSSLRPSVMQNAEANQFWRDSQKCFTSIKQSKCLYAPCCGSKIRWSSLFGLLEPMNTSSLTITGSADDFLRSRIREMGEAGFIADLQKDVEATISLLWVYRAYVYEVQDILRKVESSNVSRTLSVWGGLMPLGLICLITSLWRVSLYTPKTHVESYIPVNHFFKLLMACALGSLIYIDWSMYNNATYTVPSWWVLPPGSVTIGSLWILIARLYILYWQAIPAPIGTNDDCMRTNIWGLLPQGASSLISLATVLYQPPGALMFGATLEIIHWLLLISALSVQFAHDLVVRYQQSTARVVLHGYMVILFFKGLLYIVTCQTPSELVTKLDELPSTATYKSIILKLSGLCKMPFQPALDYSAKLKLHTRKTIIRYAGPWLMLAILIRLDDCLSPNYQTPTLRIPRPLTITSSDAISLIIVVVTALLLFQLFPFETPSENIQRFVQSLSRLSAVQISHFAHHLFFPQSHKSISRSKRPPTPARFSSRRLKRQQSGPARFDPEPPLPAFSPEGCQSRFTIQQSSGNSIDNMTPMTLSPATPSVIEDSWLKSRWPLSHLILAVIWIAQAVTCSVYFTCLKRLDLTSRPSSIHAQLSSTLLLAARALKVPEETILASDSLKILLLLLPRFNWALGLSCLLIILLAPYREYFSLQMMGTLFFICLPLQTIDEAVPFCLQLLKFQLVPIIMSQTLSVAQFSSVQKRERPRSRIGLLKSLSALEMTSSSSNSSASPTPAATPSASATSSSSGITTSEKSIALRVATCGSLAKEFCELVDHDRTNKAVNSYRREIRASVDFIKSDGSVMETPKTTYAMLEDVQSRYLFTDTEALVIIYLLMVEVYFGTGHRTDLSTLPLNSGFVGLTGFNLFLSPLFVILHCGYIFLLAPFLLLHIIERRPSLSESFSRRVVIAAATFLKIVLGLMIWANSQSLHNTRANLPAWRGYAPKFYIELVQAVLLFISFAVILRKTRRAELKWDR